VSLRRATGGDGAGTRSLRSRPDALANERDFLRLSVEDLEDQRASGEIDEEDFAVLEVRYKRRLGEVEAAIAEQAARGLAPLGGANDGVPVIADGQAVLDRRPAGEARSSRARRLRRRLGRHRVRLVIGLAATICFVAAAILLASSLAGVRLPGESATGSVSLSSAQQEQETLDRAAVLGSQGQVAEAVQLYNQVLATDPTQPDALTYGGWLVRLAGLASKNRLVLARGDASVARAVKVAPGYPDGHALFGVILYEDFAEPAAASVQFRDALSAGASKSLLMSVASIAARAFAAAKEPLPPRYRAAMHSAAAQAASS
jgi:hypothetical protein